VLLAVTARLEYYEPNAIDRQWGVSGFGRRVLD